MSDLVFGPTFEEMLYPDRIDPAVRKRALEAATADPLDPINLYNITWKAPDGKVRMLVLPPELTGVDTPIVVMVGKHFPTGSHKVGATYSVTMEKQIHDEIEPGRDTLIFPSTGNYGIGGAWVGTRLGYQSLVLLPEQMSKERFEKIRSYGADYIATVGCESNVKEIYDKCNELAAQSPRNKVLNQFEVMGNYRFHWYVTGNSALEALQQLASSGIGDGRAAAFVSAMGSAGTIAAGDRLKQHNPDCKIVGLEPIQCPTLYNNGYGDHDIQGIGDKHVTWIHNVRNMDAMIAIDDLSCKLGLQVLSDDVGIAYLAEELGIGQESLASMQGTFGISGVCNILGAIKAAKHYGFDRKSAVVTVATDSLDRYYSVMADLDATYGPLTKAEAHARVRSIFHGAGLDWIQDGTPHARDRWHNLKYYTWVEQQGKSVAQLNAQKSPEFWAAEQDQVPEFDRLLRQKRGSAVLA